MAGILTSGCDGPTRPGPVAPAPPPPAANPNAALAGSYGRRPFTSLTQCAGTSGRGAAVNLQRDAPELFCTCTWAFGLSEWGMPSRPLPATCGTTATDE